MGQRLHMVLLVGTLGALSVGPVSACGWEEKLCRPGEVFVQGVEGGSWCEPPKPGDRQCPKGEILRRIEATGREDCIPNLVEYHDRERSTSNTTS